jgi:PleD family two-component response regulator
MPTIMLEVTRQVTSDFNQTLKDYIVKLKNDELQLDRRLEEEAREKDPVIRLFNTLLEIATVSEPYVERQCHDALVTLINRRIARYKELSKSGVVNFLSVTDKDGVIDIDHSEFGYKLTDAVSGLMSQDAFYKALKSSVNDLDYGLNGNEKISLCSILQERQLQLENLIVEAASNAGVKLETRRPKLG